MFKIDKKIKLKTPFASFLKETAAPFVKKLIFFILFVGAFKDSFATHLRAGEITATRISSSTLTYRVTLTTYTDEINGKNANDAQEVVRFFFGLRSTTLSSYEVRRKTKISISPTTVQNVYDTVFTFPAPGNYTISCGIPKRNDGTVNLPAPSQSITFFIQSTIVINAQIGLNSTPVLLNIPVDSAALGVRYIHNPGAFDLDGDSLAYKLTIPMTDRTEGEGVGVPIAGYQSPETKGPVPRLNENEDAPSSFRIDPITGDLIWDAPRLIGQYNVAFIVEEWRKAPDGNYIKIGEIIRDMQIIVVETNNKRPVIEVPDDICVEAGDLIELDIRATDPDTGQRLRLTTSGGVYNRNAANQFQQFVQEEAATFDGPRGFVDGPLNGKFKWQTNCFHVREQSYDVVFKVEDAPGRFATQLADLKTIKINVNPARPKGLLAEAKENGVQLNWLPYLPCSVEGRILVYRKDGCSGLNPGICDQGMPDEWNYRLLTEVALTDTSFFDSSAVQGSIYSYRLVANLDVSSFTQMSSSPSLEFCVGSELPKSASLITEVSVLETSETAGKIWVKWTRPLNFASNLFSSPYRYALYRTEGLGGESYTLIHEKITDLDPSKADTAFIDENLNTQNTVYKYKVAFFYEQNTLLAEAPPASSVFLRAQPGDRNVLLRWEANVPWVNDNQVHMVYKENRANPGTFNLIAKIPVTTANTYVFTDNGEDREKGDGDVSEVIENNVTYCYRVVTVGVYEQQNQTHNNLGLLENISQRACATPADRTPPCPVDLVLASAGCGNLSSQDFCNPATFTNRLSWTIPQVSGGVTCRNDIMGYNIYYSRYPDQPRRQIGFNNSGTLRTYDHRKNSREGFAGCYSVSAINNLGVEGEQSNVVCVDNCEIISFPNVFSPNGDGTNDTFEPMNCPAFVKNATWEIYNRFGLLVASGSGVDIIWDGISTSGTPVSSGTYYYSIQVTFERLEEISLPVSFKGFVEVIR